MKTTKTTAALLEPQTAPATWLLTVRTRTDWCQMRFSNQAQAAGENERIRSTMTFGGAWVTDIQLTQERLGAGNE
jgi:hypothetical protein